jgi:CheY-like chemotaxis protein
MILRLLIVDDDTSLTEHLRAFFERQKYKVEVAHDGLSAVSKTREFRPHLMFLDIGLPGMSGIEVLREVKTKDPSVRVIMITGQTEDELMRQARMLGADDYVTKPFTLEYLAGEVMDKLHKQLFHELRATSQDLAIEREKAELLFAQVKDGVILFDAQGLIFMANPVAQSTLGLAKEARGLTAAKIFETFQVKQPERLVRLENESGNPSIWFARNPDSSFSKSASTPFSRPRRSDTATWRFSATSRWIGRRTPPCTGSFRSSATSCGRLW